MDHLKDRLHSEALNHIQLALKLGVKPYYEYENIQLAREAKNRTSPHLREDIKDFVGEFSEVTIPSKDVAGKVIYIYMYV